MHEKLKTKTYVYQLAHFRHLNNSVFLFISSLSSSNIGCTWLTSCLLPSWRTSNTWDAVGGILNVERMRSSVFNVDFDWMSNWLRMTMFYPKPNVWLRRSSNEVFVTYAPWKQYIVLIAIHRHLLKLKLAKGFCHIQLINNGLKVGSIIDGLLGLWGDGCRGLDVPLNIQRVN